MTIDALGQDTFKQDNYSIVEGDVGLARYEPALLRPSLTGRVLSYSNCQRYTHSISKWFFRNLALSGLFIAQGNDLSSVTKTKITLIGFWCLQETHCSCQQIWAGGNSFCGVELNFVTHCLVKGIWCYKKRSSYSYGQESKSAERYVRQGNVLPMATRIKISEIVFNERPVSIFWNNMYP